MSEVGEIAALALVVPDCLDFADWTTAAYSYYSWQCRAVLEVKALHRAHCMFTLTQVILLCRHREQSFSTSWILAFQSHLCCSTVYVCSEARHFDDFCLDRALLSIFVMLAEDWVEQTDKPNLLPYLSLARHFSLAPNNFHGLAHAHY